MNSLPTEILINIFGKLSQRCIGTICTLVCKEWNRVIKQPWFYSTIHIYSKKQLKDFIQTVNKKKLSKEHNRRIVYYVKNINIHYRYEPWNNDINDFFIFPHLQHIHGLNFYIETPNIDKSIYLELHHPVSFYYWYYNEKWIYKLYEIKEDLRLLHIYVTTELYNFIPDQKKQQTLPTTEMIYLKSIGNDKIINTSNDIDNDNDNNITQDSDDNSQDSYDNLIQPAPIKLLMLPNASLQLLTTLSIHFNNDIQYNKIDKYRINELTIENIHQSCPQLEALLLEDFVMNISKEYYSNQMNHKIIPTQRLKKLDIIMGRFYHPYCFSYFAVKYPRLISLNMNFYFKGLPLDESKASYQDAIFKMILGFPLLKKMAFGANTNFKDFFPHTQFINWLHQQQSHHYTYIGYTSDFIINNENEIASLQLQQTIYLNHITTLALCIDSICDLVKTYLLQYTNTTIVSSILKELKIIGFARNRISDVYIYDWLTFFPNITLLNIQHVKRIKDQIIDDNECADYNEHINKIKDNESIQLHRLIKKRKLQQQNEKYNIQLEHLYLGNSNLWFKNGVDTFIRECKFLSYLELDQIKVVLPISYPVDQFHLDLSTMHLKTLIINLFTCSFCDYANGAQRAFKITLEESLNGHNRVFKRLKDPNYVYTLHMFISCKYIDGFIYRL